jgi:hypothetical protein
VAAAWRAESRKDDQMTRIADFFFKAAVGFLVLGILMGLQMSISGHHNVIGAHAHSNLVGWVSMALFGCYYGLNPAKAETRLAALHFWSFAGAVAVFVPALYFYYLGYRPQMTPLLAVASFTLLFSVLVFVFVVFSKVTAERRADAGAPVEA